jgi:hypothetical protein
MSERLRVFVASSSEQLSVAGQVSAVLARDARLAVEPWNEGVFDFSKSFIESLERQLDVSDFAVVILTADDPATVREEAVNLPRDNVIFELGLFIGRLGRERCFFFVDGDADTRIASDLEGVKPVHFYRDADALAHGKPSLADQTQRVTSQMLALGVRYKPDDQVRHRQRELWLFARGLEGHWWERMRAGEDKASALSYVQISLEPASNSVRLHGDVYDLYGKPLAEWDSVATSVVLGPQPRLFYRWQGEHEATVGQTYGGGGMIRFDQAAEPSSGEGYFYDTNFALVAQGAHTVVKHFGLYRASAEDAAVMVQRGSPKAQVLVRKRLGLVGR